MPSLLKARVELAELKGYCKAIPNPMLLLSPAIIQESLASSEIENIHTTVEEVLRNQLLSETERSGPDKEVLYYREAILWGFENLSSLPLSSRLITGITERLTFGKYNSYRSTQNALTNSRTNQTVYTPPLASRIPDLMGNWENFVNSPYNQTDFTDPLIKAAAAHYQFEAIHPFGDGNGRTGRILLVLQLVQSGLIDLPVIYISGYINQHKARYYSLLNRVSSHGEWVPFTAFMLAGFEEKAKQTKDTLLNIMQLFKQTRERLKTEFKEMYSAELVETLFYSPIITPTALAAKLGVHRATAGRYLNSLAAAGLLTETSLGRHRFYAFNELLNIMKAAA